MKNKLRWLVTHYLICLVDQGHEFGQGHWNKLSISTDILMLQRTDLADFLRFYRQELDVFGVEIKFIRQVVLVVDQIIHFCFTRKP